jgi:hypothetical protein
MKSILIIILLIPARLLAQQHDSLGHFVNFKAAYLGSILYPGVSLGIEYPLRKVTFFKGNHDVPFKIKERFLTTQLSWYYHPTFHQNFFLTAGYQWRRTNKRGGFADVAPQAGFSRTFIDGTVYKVNEGGEVTRIRSAGDWFLTGMLSFSIGKELHSSSNKLNLKVYGRSSLLVLFPYNNFLYARPIVELGIIGNLKNWKVSPVKEITKQKRP